METISPASPSTLLNIRSFHVDTVLSDNVNRQRFVHEHEQNFSVVAPAGVGKTKAIVDRIVNIALNDGEREQSRLQRLVVVTYTKKAADEMHLRTRNAIMEQRVNPEVIRRLNRAYFGTIHSYCLELLRQHGILLGLPTTVDVTENDELLWSRFLYHTDQLSNILPKKVERHFFRHTQLEPLYLLARRSRIKGGNTPLDAISPYPNLNLTPLLEFPPNNRAKGKVEMGQKQLQRWLKAVEEDEGFIPPPIYEMGGKEFQELWRASFQPLRDWMSEVACILIAHVSNSYRNFRVSQGVLTYDDLVDLTAEILKDKHVGAEIRAEGKHVILDEAQDTDPAQFEVLTEIARSASAQGTWLKKGGAPPGAGRFCMVGDPQQSIYGSRADLDFYQYAHKKLLKDAEAEELFFEVTFRCDEKIVKGVNLFFPSILDGRGKVGEQVKFVPLKARPDAGSGQVYRTNLKLSPEMEGERNQQAVTLAYVQAFVGWLKNLEPGDLRARDWSEVAILCPRNEWLEALDRELKISAINTQVLSRTEQLRTLPAYAWFTALMLVISEPENAFEIAGLLREVFGISDHDLVTYYQYWKKNPERFPTTAHALQILHPVESNGVVIEKLNLLTQARQQALTLPLRDAVTYLVDAIRLRERLNALPLSHSSESQILLDNFITQSGIAEAERMSLSEWTHSLIEKMNDQVKSEASNSGHIQLLSCHKAKGLEWDAVLLPFFSRPIGFALNNYPQFFYSKGKGGPLLAIDKHHEHDDYKIQADREKEKELDRLLYVAMTRARKTLVLFNDEVFFSSNKSSFAERLKIFSDASNNKIWSSLPTTNQPETGIEKEVESEPTGETNDEEKEATFNIASLDTARNRAQGKFNRVTPHTLVKPVSEILTDRDEPELILGHEFSEESIVTSAIEYGNWWHTMMEVNRWDQDIVIWKNHCALSVESTACPLSERGKKEIDLFFKSDLVERLLASDYKVSTEAPLLWGRDDIVYEGLIDFVAYDLERKQWIIIDWKTHQNSNPELATNLREQYEPQIDAYATALRDIFGQPVNAYLYATALGQLIEIIKN